MTSFGKKSYRKLSKYMDKGMSATFIAKRTLAEDAHYHIHGGKGAYRLTEPLLVIVRPGRYDFKCDPETHEISVKVPIQSHVLARGGGGGGGGGGGTQRPLLSKEDQDKILVIRSLIVENVLQDRIGLTVGGDASDQGLVILVQAGAYNICDADGAYWIRLNLEDDQNPLGARLVPRGGPYVPRSTGSTVETASSSNRSFVGAPQPEASPGSSTKSAGKAKGSGKIKSSKKIAEAKSHSAVVEVSEDVAFQEMHRRHPGFFEAANEGPGRPEGVEDDFSRFRLRTFGRCGQQ